MQFNFRPEIEPADQRRLRDYLSTAGFDDRVDIVVENSDSHQTDILMNTLHEYGFDYQPKGGQGSAYHILAWRRPQ